MYVCNKLNSTRKMEVSEIILILSCVYGLMLTVRHQLTTSETARAVQIIEDGLSQHQVARRVSPSVVNRLWAHYL